MRACIVNSSIIGKYKSLSPAFYLGMAEEKALKVAEAEENLRAAIKRLRNARAALREEQERLRKMEEAGETREIQIIE